MLADSVLQTLRSSATGKYIRWNSFGLKTRKTNLIATLTHRAFKICSKSSLQQELDTIRSLFLKNNYPESVINARISKKILQFQKHPIEGPQRCPVYLKLPWIGETSVIFEKKIKSNILNCFSTVQPRVIFSIQRILPAIHKDVLPASQQSTNFSTSARQNPPTCPENYPQQNQSRKNSANAKK